MPNAPAEYRLSVASAMRQYAIGTQVKVVQNVAFKSKWHRKTGRVVDTETYGGRLTNLSNLRFGISFDGKLDEADAWFWFDELIQA